MGTESFYKGVYWQNQSAESVCTLWSTYKYPQTWNNSGVLCVSVYAIATQAKMPIRVGWIR